MPMRCTPEDGILHTSGTRPDRGDYTWMVRRFTETSAVMLTNAIAIK